VLTRLRIRGFKGLASVDIELANPVLFIGPNNSGKTTALQALTLWDLGRRKWLARHGTTQGPPTRPGVTLNRAELTSVPVGESNLLWLQRRTSNAFIDIVVDGVDGAGTWTCGFEFYYANKESFYCRPMRRSDARKPERVRVPESVEAIRVSMLPPMSGLSEREFIKQTSEIDYLVGQGRTAEVLRNICFRVAAHSGDAGHARWRAVSDQMRDLFGVQVLDPGLDPALGTIDLHYVDRDGTKLDISASGRGQQQTLMLLSWMALHPGSVLLLDEPDAHLEILRQRQVYDAVSDHGERHDCQIIAATHSEVLLNAAAGRDVVVAFVGQPHRIDDRGTQARKALKDIGHEHYYLAEAVGWVLYVEGSTDEKILLEFARLLGHPAAGHIERALAVHVGDQPKRAQEHFFGLREAKHDLQGFAVFDRLDLGLAPNALLRQHMWHRREIENYFMSPAVLERFAEAQGLPGAEPGPLFEHGATQRRAAAMRSAWQRHVTPAARDNPDDSWWLDVKASTDFLTRVFEDFYLSLELPNLMRKTNFHRLVPHLRPEEVDQEVVAVLDAIVEVAGAATPRHEEPVVWSLDS